MKVIKFGGTSVGSVENIRRIDEIVRNQQTDLVVVVSAVGGVTDLLLAAARAGAKGDEVELPVEEIRNRHLRIMNGLFEEKVPEEVRSSTESGPTATDFTRQS